MRVLSGLLLSVFAVTGPTACNDNNDKNTATLTVSTDDLVLGGEAGESETFTITTTAAWKAVPSGEGFTLDKTEGTGDATVRVTAAAGNWDGYVKQLGSIEIAATSVDGVKTVSVSQDEITPVLPSEVRWELRSPPPSCRPIRRITSRPGAMSTRSAATHLPFSSIRTRAANYTGSTTNSSAPPFRIRPKDCFSAN